MVLSTRLPRAALLILVVIGLFIFWLTTTEFDFMETSLQTTSVKVKNQRNISKATFPNPNNYRTASASTSSNPTNYFNTTRAPTSPITALVPDEKTTAPATRTTTSNTTKIVSPQPQPQAQIPAQGSGAVPVLLAQSPGFTLDQEGKTEPIALVNAFSDNHLQESFRLFRSLIKVGYKGPLVIYVMREQNTTLSPDMEAFIAKISNSRLLNVQVFGYEEPEHFRSYCFKPRVVQYFLSLYSEKTTSLIWADTSIDFLENPLSFAQRLIHDKVAISAITGTLGMYENTDPQTYAYLNISRTKYIKKKELAATTWIMNLRLPGVMSEVLQPWIDCAVLACRQCMAPPNTTKSVPKGTKWRGAGGTTYIAHRQDQSVLSLLEYEYLDKKRGQISINSKKYLNAAIKRGLGKKEKPATLDDIA